MITLTNTNGQRVYLAPAAIAEVQETSASSQWHGINAIIRTFDGRVIEVREHAADVVKELS